MSICKNLNQKRWRPWSRALSDSQILGVMSNEGRGLFRGCYFGKETRYGALDIDIGSQYHSQEVLTKLLQEFSLLGLELTPYQSSDSGGWHLYFFFSRFVLSQEVERTIKSYLRFRGYEIKSGTLEVFPSGNALRLPLQKGFGWLGSDGKVETKREDLTAEQAIAAFLGDLTKTQSNWDDVKSKIESEISEARAAAGMSGPGHLERVSADGLEGLYRRGVDHETYQRGRNYWENGLFGASQRHDAILCVGHYLWFGDPSQGVRALPGLGNAGARAKAILQWLREKHNGHSETINLGRWHDVHSDIENACYWTPKGSLVREKESYPLTDRLVDRLCETKVLTPEQYAKANRRREGAARSKIRAALNEMLAEGKHPTIRNIALASGCRRETVKKHSDIWGIYAVRAETRMSTGLGDLSGGAGGISSVPASSAASFVERSDQPLSVISHITPKSASNSFGILGSDSFALFAGSCSEDSKALVAPLFHGWRVSQPESAHIQAQVLRMPSASLSMGPQLSGIQPLRHVTAGGVSSTSLVCYSAGRSSGITGGIGERWQVTAETGSLSYLPGKYLKTQTVFDTINSTFLTIKFNGLGTGLEDKILKSFPNLQNADGLESQSGQAIELEQPDSISSPLFSVYSRYCFDTG